MHSKHAHVLNSERQLSTPRARVTCWGGRGTCPSPGPQTVRYGGNTACVEVQLSGGARVILDAGTGLRALGQSLTAPPSSIDGARATLTLLLTHRHSDHLIGLAHFAPILTRSHAVRIACGDVDAAALYLSVEQQLTAPLFPTLDRILDGLLIERFDDAQAFQVDATCRVQALAARHPGGASVLRINDAQGPVMAYAPDNELAFADESPSIVAWRLALAQALRGIPVLFHDATYTDEELPSHRGWGHSSAEEATQFAMICRAGTLLLTHHHPDRSDDAIDAIVARCQAMAVAAGSPLHVTAASEGMAVSIT